MRSFTKRISDYIKYQAATRDMHARYPDATAEDLASDGVCIVCREDMKPWAGNIPAGGVAPPNTTTNERQRPKKLPCGHILHFSCLQSWMERQQACPICRRSVFAAPPGPAGQAAQVNGQPAVPGIPGAPNANPANPNQPQARLANRNEGRIFRFRLGPLRLQFGGGRMNGQDRDQFVNDLFARLRDQRNANGVNRPPPVLATPINNPAHTAAQTTDLAARVAAHNAETIATHAAINESVEPIHPAVRSAVSHMQIDLLETQIRQEISSLSLANSRLNGLRAILAELDRARAMERAQTAVPGLQQIRSMAIGLPALPTTPRHGASGQQNLGGIVVPPGWTLVPLNPVQVPQTQPTAPTAEASTAPTPTPTIPPPFTIPTAPSLSADTPSSSSLSSSTPSPAIAGSSADHPLSDPVPEAASSTAPLVPTPTWSFSSTNAAPAVEGSVAEGKRPVSDRDVDAGVGVPETVVEPPTPVRERKQQAFVEDGEGEDE